MATLTETLRITGSSAYLIDDGKSYKCILN